MQGEEIDEDDVSCSVCLELYKQPTPLPCRHTFCRPCVLAIVPRQTTCPMCRAPFGLPLRPVDEALAGQVRLFTQKQEQLLKAVVENVVPPPYLRRDEWLVILRMLEKWDGPKAVARVGSVSKGMYRVAQDAYLWRDLCMRDFAFVPSEDDGCKPSWRRRYDAAKRRAWGWNHGKPSDWKLSTLRGPASHVTQLVAKQGSRVAVRYADGTALQWDSRTDAQSPDDTPELPALEGLEVAPGKSLRLDGATLQLRDATGAVLSSLAVAHHSAAVRMSFDAGHVVLGGANTTVYAVSLQAPFSIAVRCVLSCASPSNAVHILQRRVVSGHQDHCVRVWDMEKPEAPLYALLGGSLRPRPDNPPHPTRPGCSALVVDSARIVAAFGAVVKSFALVGDE